MSNMIISNVLSAVVSSGWLDLLVMGAISNGENVPLRGKKFHFETRRSKVEFEN